MKQVLEYEVQDILAEKTINKKHFYLIKWKGYPQSQNTWEPTENLQNIIPYLQQWKKQKVRDKRRKKLQNVSKRVKSKDFFINQPSNSISQNDQMYSLETHKQTLDQKIKKSIKQTFLYQVSQESQNLSKDRQKDTGFKSQKQLNDKQQTDSIKDMKYQQSQLSSNCIINKKAQENANIQNPPQIYKYTQENLQDQTNAYCNLMSQYKEGYSGQNQLQKLQRCQQIVGTEAEMNNSLLSLSCQQNYPYIPNEIQSQVVTRILKIVYVSTRKYYWVELIDGKQVIINEINMRNMFPKVICDYYEQFIEENQHNQTAIKEPPFETSNKKNDRNL